LTSQKSKWFDDVEHEPRRRGEVSSSDTVG
jgi:hypothetical protein